MPGARNEKPIATSSQDAPGMKKGRGRHPASRAAIQPPPSPAATGNLRSLKHGAYSPRVKGARVRELLEELRAEHPQEAEANLRALAELYVTAERLSAWVAGQEDAGISASGAIAPALLEARKA